MDTPSLHSNTSQQRRRLTKKNPSQHSVHTNTTPSFDAGFDDLSSPSRRSSHSLRRAPSAPHAHSTHSGASNASSPRHLPATAYSNSNSNSNSTQQRSNHSPNLLQGEFASPAAYDIHPADPHLQQPLSQQASDDFIGAPFDGAAILNRLDSPGVTSPNPQPSPSPYFQPSHTPQRSQSTVHRPRIPQALASFGQDKRVVSPPLRSSASFSNMDSTLSEKIHGGRSGDRPIEGNPKRYSDDGKDLKSTMLRKKSGLTGFVNSLVGSQKKPVISAPENPVHVTHVGYDSSTGQFTVGSAQGPERVRACFGE